MVEQDTVKLLRECDEGIKMGVESIEDVIPKVHDDRFKDVLTDSKEKHQQLKKDMQILLKVYHDDGKSPNVMARGMSWFRTAMIGADDDDSSAASFITDGCNMGVKYLHKYLNQYKAADEKSKDIAKRLINLEEKLAVDIRDYL